MTSLAIMIPVKYQGANDTLVRVTLLAGSLFLAYSSWKYVETPFRRIRSWPSCVRPLAPLFLILVLVALGNAFEIFGTSPYAFEQRYVQGFSLTKPDELSVGLLGNPSKPTSFVLLGNSHAQSVAPAIDELAEQYSVRGVFMLDGVMPFLNMSLTEWDRIDIDYRQSLREFITTHNIEKVLVVARWDHIWEHAREQRVLWRDEQLDISAVEEVFFQELVAFISELSSSGVDVWIMEQVPRAEVNPIIALRILDNYTEPYMHGIHNELVRKAVTAVGGHNVYLLDPYEYFVINGNIHFTHSSDLLYYDTNHLSVEGSHHLKKLFTPFFEFSFVIRE